MNRRLVLCLLTFITYYVCAFPKNKTNIKHSNSLNNNKNATRSVALNDKSHARINLDDVDYDYDDSIQMKLYDHINKTRKLVTGDTFTPRDMLPIATKLLQKVDEPGSGRGFVSSVRSPEELADKLYEAFFMTTKRIVILKDIDISGIDALQALALSGESAENNQEELDSNDSISEPTTYLRGQFVKIHDKPKESKYTLVTRTVGRERSKAKRRGIALAKKLKKERNLIINKQRRNEKREKKNDENSNRRHKKEKVNESYNKSKVQPTERSHKELPKCRWQYVCKNATDLDSCRLRTACGLENLKVTTEDIVVKHKGDEQSSLVQFRKMLGLSPVDEEVKKILESRHLLLKPANSDAIIKAEALSEYFNKIVLLDSFVTVTAKSNNEYIWPNDTHTTIDTTERQEDIKDAESAETKIQCPIKEGKE